MFMKIILVDNYDTERYDPIIVAEKVNVNFAERIVNLLNEQEEEEYGDYSPNYYMLKEE